AFFGYSDITALHVALRQRAGLATFYGPHLMTMGWTRASDLTRERLLAVLAGAILFFEEVDAPPWYVDGMLTQLGQAGKLAGVVGGGGGAMERCDWSAQRPEWPRTKSLEQVLEEHLEPLGVPVLYGLPIGHARHLATLPLGVTATLDADARTLTVDRPALRPVTGGAGHAQICREARHPPPPVLGPAGPPPGARLGRPCTASPRSRPPAPATACCGPTATSGPEPPAQPRSSDGAAWPGSPSTTGA